MAEVNGGGGKAPLSVVRIHFKNVMALDDFEIRPGKVTLVEGSNAAGKTSVLEGVRSVLRGGHDGTLLRTGEDAGSVVFELDDEMEITKTLGAHKSKFEARHPDFGPIGAAKTWLDGLTDPVGINPVELIHEKDESKRLRRVLEAIPLEMDGAALAAVMSAVEKADADLLIPAPVGHPLTALDLIHKVIYSKRRGLNSVAKERTSAAKGLRPSLPSDDVDLETLRAGLVSTKAVRQELLGKVAQDRDDVEQGYQAALRAAADARTSAIEAAHAAFEAERDRLTPERDEGKEAITAAAKPDLTKLNDDAVRFAERIDAENGHANTRAVIAENESAAEKAKATSEALTAALTALDVMRSRLADQIPLDGVTVQDGQLMVDGVVFRRANTARKVDVVVGVAELRAGRLPLVCVDGAECLDADTFDALVARLKASPLQAILTRVTKGPLTVSAL